MKKGLHWFKEINPKSSNVIFENKLNQTEEFNLIEYLYFYNGGGVATGVERRLTDVARIGKYLITLLKLT